MKIDSPNGLPGKASTGSAHPRRQLAGPVKLCELLNLEPVEPLAEGVTDALHQSSGLKHAIDRLVAIPSCRPAWPKSATPLRQPLTAPSSNESANDAGRRRDGSAMTGRQFDQMIQNAEENRHAHLHSGLG